MKVHKPCILPSVPCFISKLRTTKNLWTALGIIHPGDPKSLKAYLTAYRTRDGSRGLSCGNYGNSGHTVSLLSSSFLAQCSLVTFLEVMLTPVGCKVWPITSLDGKVFGKKIHHCWKKKCSYIFKAFTDISPYVRDKQIQCQTMLSFYVPRELGT